MHPKTLFLFLTLSVPVFGQQIPIGTWRSHLNYSSAHLVAVYQHKVYVASEFGLFYLDREDNSLNRLTKNDGFSDVGISAMATTPDSEKLIIGYKSGQIDILEGNKLSSLDVIKASSIAEDKTINRIVFHNGSAFLATNFGLVVLDYQKNEIKEGYSQIGQGGTRTRVSAAAVYQDSIFLATSNGIIATALSPTNNLQDFNNWRRFEIEEGLPVTAFPVIASFNNFLYIGIDGDGVYRYDGNQWQKTSFLPSEDFVKMQARNDLLYIITSQKIYQLSKEQEINLIAEDMLHAPSDVAVTKDGVFCIADRQKGLISNFGGNFESFYPDGPFSDHIHKLKYFDGKIAAMQRGFDEEFNPLNNPAAFTLFAEGRWENYTATNVPLFVGVHDLTDIAYSPLTSTLYFSSFGGGVFGWETQENTFFKLNQKAPGHSIATGKITAISSGPYGDLFFNEYKAADILHVLDENDGHWEAVPLGPGRHVSAILSSPMEELWLSLTKNILVLDPQTGNSKLLTSENNNLISNKITTFAYDKDGTVWYGTSNGIAFVPNPWTALEGSIRSVIPVYENSALLDNDYINALEIDGANRKWIATKDGLWIFGEDGERLIAHFTEENSPLLSNQIRDIEINAVTGEVFIATAKGMVSFRSKASEAGTVHQQVKIFPNPVNPDFNGQIGISGLVENAIVKITDLSGNLVREIRALGGTATWDGRDLYGGRVNAGIYLIFSASEDGQESFVGKLAFIR